MASRQPASSSCPPGSWTHLSDDTVRVEDGARHLRVLAFEARERNREMVDADKAMRERMRGLELRFEATRRAARTDPSA